MKRYILAGLVSFAAVSIKAQGIELYPSRTLEVISGPTRHASGAVSIKGEDSDTGRIYHVTKRPNNTFTGTITQWSNTGLVNTSHISGAEAARIFHFLIGLTEGHLDLRGA